MQTELKCDGKEDKIIFSFKHVKSISDDVQWAFSIMLQTCPWGRLQKCIMFSLFTPVIF